MAHFDPQRLAVYRVAREHSRAVHALLSTADTRGYSDLVSQLRRSTSSIPANVLEAHGEWRPGKRIHYLYIAKGSTWESWAHVDTLVDFGLIAEAEATGIRSLQSEITALLIATIRRLEQEHDRSPVES